MSGFAVPWSCCFNRIVVAIILCLFILGTSSPSECRAEDDGVSNSRAPLLPNSKWRVNDRSRPQPPKVVPGNKPGAPPADAVVLFGGKDFSQWEHAHSTDNAKGINPKIIEDGAFNILKTGWIQTKRHFGDCQLHIEWATPETADGNNCNWGNSGIFFLGQYELQIIESHDSKIYADGMAGSIYGQTPPLVNAARKPGQWQTFDVVFTAPRFDGEKLLSPAYITVLWNGVLVQNHTEVMGSTRWRTFPNYRSFGSTGPLVLQQHGSAVRYRNIWIRPLKRE